MTIINSEYVAKQLYNDLEDLLTNHKKDWHIFHPNDIITHYIIQDKQKPELTVVVVFKHDDDEFSVFHDENDWIDEWHFVEEYPEHNARIVQLLHDLAKPASRTSNIINLMERYHNA